jgi:hypothetical protein
MVEESPESFISKWRRHAAQVELYAHTEGSPMLECRAGDLIMQLFERTGPYQSRPGTALVIINPVIEALTVLDGPSSDEPHVESLGVSRIRLSGTVIERDGRTMVVDAGLPLVVSSLDRMPDAVQVGTSVSVTSSAPVHAFVVADHVTTAGRNAERHDDLL